MLLAAVLLAKHLEHAVRDEKTADDIDRGGGHGQAAEHAAQPGSLARAGNQYRSDHRDSGDRVGQRHQRCVEQRRNALHQLQAERHGENQHVNAHLNLSAHAFTPNSACTFGCTTSPPRATMVSRVISSLRAMFNWPSFIRFLRNATMFRAYIWLAWEGNAGRRGSPPGTPRPALRLRCAGRA